MSYNSRGISLMKIRALILPNPHKFLSKSLLSTLRHWIASITNKAVCVIMEIIILLHRIFAFFFKFSKKVLAALCREFKGSRDCIVLSLLFFFLIHIVSLLS